jgi:hypothetical protein
MARPVAALLALALLGAAVTAASTPTSKLHPFLAEKLASMPSLEKVPVYFVMKDRLGYDHWFPRIQQMGIEERRALVIRELMAHANQTQAELIGVLRSLEGFDRVDSISSNWLGNFVQCHATPAAILDAAALESVAEVWYDATPPLAEVEDAAPPMMGTALAPGNGPLSVKADQVWALGFRGQGVVVMNTDSGINVNHNDLRNRLWVNPGEIPANSQDDDRNGYIDDINGWNYGSNNNNLNDSGGHGTNTAGCLVADGTCNGTIYGMAPEARVITGALGGESSQWNGIQYALLMGAHTQTSSHSYKNNFTPPPNYKMHRELSDNTLAAGLIRTNSTSNNGSACTGTSTIRRPFNISAPGCDPAPYVDPNQTLAGRRSGVIGVAAYEVATRNLASYTPCGPFAWNLPDLLAVLPSYPPANWNTTLHNDYPWTGGTQQGCLKPDISAPTSTTTTSGTGTCGTATFSGTSNATPCANGVLILWKSANMSLKPEDIAMIVHQTAEDAGTTPGKENNWGAGRIDALAGVYRARCVHRVNGDPGWTVNHRVNTAITLELDGSEGQAAVMAVGLSRTPVVIPGLVTIGIGLPFYPLFVGATDPSGNASFTMGIGPELTGVTVFTQGVIDDRAGATQRFLASNVIGVRFVP